MIEITKLIIENCHARGLEKEETATVLQLLHTVEQRSDMLDWLTRKTNRKLEPIDIIIAAGEIQLRHKQLSSKLK